jgi:plasmid maintenance system antidote protein VapI
LPSAPARCTTALRLGHWFGICPEFWLNLQKLYELRVARAEVGERVKKLPWLTGRKHVNR